MSSKTKKFFWIAAIIIFLLILGGKFLQGLWHYRTQAVFLSDTQVFEESLAQIHLNIGPRRIALLKKDNVWRIVGQENYPADEAWVKEIIENLTNASLEGVVSTRSEKYKEFNLEGDETIGFEAKDHDGKTLISGFLGKQLLGQWDRLYWRFGDKSEVFIVKGLNRYLFEKSLEDLKKKETKPVK